MTLEKFKLRQEQGLRIRKILVNSLNTVSYASQERDKLISLVTSEILLKDEKLLWLDNLNEFLAKNKKNCIKTYSKYYYKDIYEKLYNDFYLGEFKKFLDTFIIRVRQFKTEEKSELKMKLPVIKFYEEKRSKTK